MKMSGVLVMLVVLAVTVPAYAQETVSSPNTAEVASSAPAADAQARPANGLTVPELAPAMPQRNSFKLVAGDFKHFFSADTAHTLGYTSLVAIDRPGRIARDGRRWRW